MNKEVDMKVNIVVNLILSGVHCWTSCDISEVSYLKNLHRHQFYINCRKTVKHEDRDIEIIMFKRRIVEELNSQFYDDVYKCLNFGSMSCEMIASMLIMKYDLCYCSVLEDNENGAEVYREDSF